MNFDPKICTFETSQFLFTRQNQGEIQFFCILLWILQVKNRQFRLLYATIEAQREAFFTI